MIGMPWVGEAVEAETATVMAEQGAIESGCTASATCWDGSRISCSGSTSCLAYDNDCPASRGSVTCDGSTTYCSYCKGYDSDCPEAGLQCLDDSDCIPPPTQLGCADCECYHGRCACPYF